MPAKPQKTTFPPTEANVEEQLKALDQALAALTKKKRARGNVAQIEQNENRLKAAKASLEDKGLRPKILSDKLAEFGFNVGAKRHQETLNEPAVCFEQFLRLAAPTPTPSTPSTTTATTAQHTKDLASLIRSDPLFSEIVALAEDNDDDLPLLATCSSNDAADPDLQKDLDDELVHYALCAGSRFAWSFCSKKLVDAEKTWHCTRCVACQSTATTRHCDVCDLCFELDLDSATSSDFDSQSHNHSNTHSHSYSPTPSSTTTSTPSTPSCHSANPISATCPSCKEKLIALSPESSHVHNHHSVSCTRKKHHK
ncbi:UNVERIFIED_CONTAM: hypothetical protein HDU68_002350 [Siphonaria sp. JEL0065]|nr:hypothetical protein HDU68_002350 [Siphonaria sp. JEL0065]